jgi:hypothetical protein
VGAWSLFWLERVAEKFKRKGTDYGEYVKFELGRLEE